MNAATTPADLLPDLKERSDVQLAAMTFLARLGYHCLTAEQALALRDGKTSHILLEDVLRNQLIKINAFRYKGREHKFSSANIRRAIQALEEVSLAEGTQRAGEKVYDLLRLGKSLEEAVEGDTKSFTLRYIDWETPGNNVFHAVSEYVVQRAASRQVCRLDMVLFVNGIPFVVIECEPSTGDIDRGVQDLLAYQKLDYVPDLFKYVQIVLATNRLETTYATTGTTPDYWSVWRPEPEDEEAIEAKLGNPLPAPDLEAMEAIFVRDRKYLYAAEAKGRLVTHQDGALYCLCEPARLLDLVKGFVLYDAGIKKIARYQQYRAVKRSMRRIFSRYREGRRPGGVIWHTQGSGKSLTMVMLANAIALSKKIENPRILLVTDRVNLDKQIAGTFHRCGLDPRRATSGTDLRRLIQDDRAAVITTLLQKFQAVLTQGDLVADSPDIFIMVDESHRTNYGSLAAQMRRVFPNACYLAFTGTPLLREDKNTVAKFGGMIDTYPMEQAVADKEVVPLLYERRHVPQAVEEPIDRWFERICQGLTDAQRLDLKRKFSRSDVVLRAEQRLREIAYDVWAHYRANWQQDGYYKAQLVAPTRKAALLLQKYLNEAGEATGQKVSSRVVITLWDEREGEEADDDPNTDQIAKFRKEIEGEFGSEERYEESMIERFRDTEEPEILIVVDKLLTGFDAPCNTVLYLARRLTHHSLLQAIARVNRLYEGKEFGYIIDYVGILGELNRALNEYKALAGFDLADIEGTLESIRKALDDLPKHHADLLAFFNPVRNLTDSEALERYLIEDQERRQSFYALLREFAGSLRIALSTELFYEETDPETIQKYKDDLTRFLKIRYNVQKRCAEVVSLKQLEPMILKLLDTYVTSEPIEILTPEPINIFDTKAMEEGVKDLHGTAAKADAIAYATERTLIERMDEDPALYRKFSEMIRETIQAFRDGLIREKEYLQQVLAIRNQFVTGKAGNVPERLVGNEVAQAYYRIVLEKTDELAKSTGDREVSADIALMIDAAIRRELVVDWRQKMDVQNRMRANIDDGFFELAQQGKIELNWPVIDDIAGEAARVAKSRLP